MKLWAKLTAVTVLTVLLGAGTAGAAVLFRSVEYNRQREMESCREQLSVAAYAMGREMDRTLLKEYSPAAKNSYLDFLLQKFGSASYILLENGEEICNQTLYRLKDGEKKIWQEEQAWSRFQKLEDGYFVIAGQSIPSGLDASYTLILIRDISDLYRQGKRQLAEGTVILAVTMLAAALLTFLFVKRILRPLGELEAAAKQISQGRLGQQVQVKGRDEIGELAEAFNHMSQQLERQVEELSQVADRRKLLLGSMAHEMKTPMTSIIGYADTLLHVKLKKEQQEKALEHIYAASTRLERLSGKLMELIGLYDNDSIHMEETDMKALFARVKELEEKPLEERDLSLRCFCKMEKCLVDPDLMESLLLNLIENAARASSPGETIFLTGKGSTILVEDQGCGIPEKEVGKITEAFYMVDKARSKSMGGSGLGLAICSRIALLHGAALKIESTPGEGTRVWVRLREGEKGEGENENGNSGKAEQTEKAADRSGGSSFAWNAHRLQQEGRGGHS